MTHSGGSGLKETICRAGVVLTLLVSSTLRADPAPFPYARIGVANGCFVESVMFGDELRTRFGGDIWYRILQWGAKEADEVVAGHAVVVFEHRDRLWSFDINHKFTAIQVPPAQRGDVGAVAKEATAPYLDKIVPRYPIYREDFPQAPDPTPPAPFDDVEERDLRDAGLVAARLARYRPVTLVEFTYPKDGESRRGAAVAFVYSGRLCVYSASAGTTPFRVKALSVENRHQLQELLRRIYPGVSNVKVR
jgi:hypothetical protein